MNRLLIVFFGLPPLAALLHIQVCTDGLYRKKKKGRFVPLSNQITEAFFPQILVKTAAPAAFEK